MVDERVQAAGPDLRVDLPVAQAGAVVAPPDAVAERAGTNGYEVLTSLGRRYRRVYGGA